MKLGLVYQLASRSSPMQWLQWWARLATRWKEVDVRSWVEIFLKCRIRYCLWLSFKCQHPSPYNSNSQTKEMPHDFYNNSKRHYRKYWSVSSFYMTTPKDFLSSTTWHCGTHSLVSLDFSRLLQMESLLAGQGEGFSRLAFIWLAVFLESKLHG